MSESPHQTRPRGRDDVLFRQLDDEWVLFDPTTDRLHVLNLTAALVWTHCTGELDVAGIARAVASSFPAGMANAATITDDIDTTLKKFGEQGLLA